MTTNFTNITMSGGLSLHIKSVILYPKNQLHESISLWQQAENKLGKPTEGIGFMGSPSFVLGAVATAALFTKWQKNQFNKEAIELVEDANNKYQLALEAGREFELNQVENIASPDPIHWQANIFEDLKRKEFIARSDGKIQLRTIENKLIWIMWHHVAAYEPC